MDTNNEKHSQPEINLQSDSKEMWSVTEPSQQKDESFEDYIRNARNEFSKIVTKHFPHIQAENSILLPEGIELRTACEDILIAYDQMRERLSSPPEPSSDRGCPCKYLDEPCHPRCTCVNGASSLGCIYCATYGSIEQRKEAAKRIAHWIEKGREPSSKEQEGDFVGFTGKEKSVWNTCIGQAIRKAKLSGTVIDRKAVHKIIGDLEKLKL